MLKPHFFRSLWIALLVVFLGSFGGSSLQAAAPPIPEGLLYALLRETDEGIRIARTVLGTEVRSRAQLDRFIRTIEGSAENYSYLRAELAHRIAQIESASGLRIAPSTTLAPKNVSLLKDLAREHLNIPAVAGRNAFLPEPAQAPSLPLPNADSPELVPALKNVLTFEDAVPLKSGSIEDRLPGAQKIYSVLTELEKKYLFERLLLFPDELSDRLRATLGRPPTLRDMIERMLQERISLAHELSVLSETYRNVDPQLHLMLRETAKKIGVSSKANERFRQKMKAIGTVLYRKDSQHEEVKGYVASIRGEIGELKVAVRESNVVLRGVMVHEIADAFTNPSVSATVRKEIQRLASLNGELLSKELDLVFENSRIWGEVKYFRTVMSRGHTSWGKVIKQANLTLNIKSVLERNNEVLSAFGGPLELRLYFVQGITEDAAQTLEQMGFRVFGPRYLKPQGMLKKAS